MRWAAPVVRLLCCCCFIALRSTTTTMGILAGTPVTCTGEGKEVSVPIVANNSCIKCFCEDGKVVCTNHRRCSDTSTCYVIALPKPPESCCDEVCKGCAYGNKAYSSDDVWTDSKDPCVTLECKAGIITRTKQLCHMPCKDYVHIPGQCCPVCRGCTVGRSTYQRGMNFPDPRDPCTTCTCQEDGNLQCSRRACPVLNCPERNVVHVEGSCCPVCQGKRRVFTVPGKCLYHPHGTLYSNGQTIVEDACGKCSCQGGTVLCDRMTCPRLACSAIDVVPPESGSGCCPRCRPVPRKCRDGSSSHQHGKSWFRDLCTRCYCNDGTMHCRREDCAGHSQHCPQNTHELQYVPGACCPQCIEKSATCVVFGDPHYKTFDGLLYTFHGSCGYVLARPCSSKRDFSVTAQNVLVAPHHHVGGRGVGRAVTASLTLRLGELSITLHRDLSVSVNGAGVTLPFLRLGRVSVVQQGYALSVTTHVGVRVRWDGGAYTELVVPRSYKGRMCGLCGNYNGARDDEWTGRRGGSLRHAYASADEFGDSWQLPDSCGGSSGGSGDQPGGSGRTGTRSKGCHGSSSSAAVRNDSSAEQTAAYDDSDAQHKCSVLKGALFAPCLAALPATVDDYFEACVRRVCNCPAGEQCLCGVLKEFWQACYDGGVKLDVDLPCGSG